MFQKIKQQALRHGMKLLSDPKVAQWMADPRFLAAITKALELKGLIQSEIDSRLRSVACLLNLATRADLNEVEHNIKHDLERTLRDVVARCDALERRADDGAES